MFYKTELLLTIFLIFCGTVLTAQAEITATAEAIPREIGVRFSGFDDFNLFYKKEKAMGVMARHRVLQTNIDYNSNNKDWDLGLGYAYGVEKYKGITEKLSFFHGLEGALFVAYSTSGGGQLSNKSLRLVPSLGYVLGFKLELSDRYRVGIEVIPALRGNITIRNGEVSTYQVGAGLNSNSTALSLMYRFVAGK